MKCELKAEINGITLRSENWGEPVEVAGVVCDHGEAAYQAASDYFKATWDSDDARKEQRAVTAETICSLVHAWVNQEEA